MMEDPGVADLSTEDASSMAMAAAEAAAAAEEQELAAAASTAAGGHDPQEHSDSDSGDNAANRHHLDHDDDDNDEDNDDGDDNEPTNGDVGVDHHQLVVDHQDFAPHDVVGVNNPSTVTSIGAEVGMNVGVNIHVSGMPSVAGGISSEDGDNPHHSNEHDANIMTNNNNDNDNADDDDDDGDHRRKCRICCKGPDDDGRVLCRFLPAQVDGNTLAIAPLVITFDQDIALHVFCGKTASILPNVNQPDLEILSKAGIKNKHGIGPEVNGALARTRSSTVSADGAKEKTFYIVKEFEAHLAAIRSASMSVAAAAAAAMDHRLQQQQHQQQQQQQHLQQLPNAYQHHSAHLSVHPGTPLVDSTVGPPVDPAFDPLYHTAASMVAVGPPHQQHHHQHNNNSMKVLPHKAGHSYQKQQQQQHHHHLSAHNQRPAAADPWIDVTITPDGKIRCGCGGTHLPTGTAKGDASWRSHVMTKRHQKWMEENGLLGAV